MSQRVTDPRNRSTLDQHLQENAQNGTGEVSAPRMTAFLPKRVSGLRVTAPQPGLVGTRRAIREVPLDPLLKRAIRDIAPAAGPFAPSLETEMGILSHWHEVAQAAHLTSGDEFGEVERIFQ